MCNLFLFLTVILYTPLSAEDHHDKENSPQGAASGRVNVQGVSEPLRRYLEQQGINTKSDATVKSHLV